MIQKEQIGTLVFSFGNTLFSEISKDYLVLGKTGETVIGFANQGGDVEFLTPVRFGEKARTLKKTEEAVPIVQAVIHRRNDTFESATDYRGANVIAVTKYLDNVNWGLVVKMDKSEIFSLFQDLKNATILISSIAILFFIISIFMIKKENRS